MHVISLNEFREANLQSAQQFGLIESSCTEQDASDKAETGLHKHPYATVIIDKITDIAQAKFSGTKANAVVHHNAYDSTKHGYAGAAQIHYIPSLDE